MGMELIEITIEVEEKFGINIPNDVAVELVTPRMLTDYVMTQVEKSDRPVCHSQKVFHLLRRTFIGNLGLPRHSFRLDTELERIVPLADRRRLWRELGASSGVSSWPELDDAKWVGVVGACFMIAVFFASLFGAMSVVVPFDSGSELMKFAGGALSFLIAVLIGYCSVWVLSFFAKPIRRQLPCRRVRELVQTVLAANPAMFQDEAAGWTRDQVAAAVRRIIIDVGDVSDFTEDSHFVRDMGLG